MKVRALGASSLGSKRMIRPEPGRSRPELTYIRPSGPTRMPPGDATFTLLRTVPSGAYPSTTPLVVCETRVSPRRSKSRFSLQSSTGAPPLWKTSTFTGSAHAPRAACVPVAPSLALALAGAPTAPVTSTVAATTTERIRMAT